MLWIDATAPLLRATIIAVLIKPCHPAACMALPRPPRLACSLLEMYPPSKRLSSNQTLTQILLPRVLLGEVLNFAASLECEIPADQTEGIAGFFLPIIPDNTRK